MNNHDACNHIPVTSRPHSEKKREKIKLKTESILQG